MTGAKSTSDRAAAQTGAAGRHAGGGLFDGFEAYRTPVEADYRTLLTDGIVVPDANVFLNLYRYNEQTRDDLFAVLRGLGDRLWVPHQVVVEFWRNREGVLQDPRDTSATIRDLLSQRDRAISTFQSWANRVSLREQRTAELVGILTHAFTTITDGVSELADRNASDFARNTNKDPVLLELEHILRGRVGAALSKDDYATAVVEAKRRADSKIPPGYRDSGKDPVASVGDYLVWLQTARQAEIEKRDVLFVTGDVKEDWWRREHGESRGPRPELVEELKEQASVQLFMLRPESLLLQARQALKIAVRDESVQDIERVDQLSASLSVPTDVEGVRARWREVLDSVRGKRRVAWILISNATVSDFDAETLTLEFSRDGEARGFSGSDYSSDLNAALEEVFGIRRKILAAAPSGVVYEENTERPQSPRVTPLSPGDKVLHERYGAGMVLSNEGTLNDPEAKIDFGGEVGVKHLVLRYASVRKIASA